MLANIILVSIGFVCAYIYQCLLLSNLYSLCKARKIYNEMNLFEDKINLDVFKLINCLHEPGISIDFLKKKDCSLVC